MNFLSSIRIATKLPLIIVSLCLVVSTAIAVLGYFSFRAAILNETEKAYQIVTEERRHALQTLFSSFKNDITGLGSDPTVATAVRGLSNVYGVMMDNPTDYLQGAYINQNPHPVGERDKLDQAEGAVPYNYRHAEFHPYFRSIKDGRGYYDLFLFDLSGNLIYTVYKEADFATNFIDGPYKQTGLGRAMRDALEGEQGQIFFADFAPYAPSNGDPASFVTTPVFDAQGTRVGVVAVQIPADPISAITNKAGGLGETGDIYLVGPDLTSRSTSRFEGHFDFFDRLPAVPQVQSSRDGSDNFFPKVTGLDGLPVVARSLTMDVFGTKWGLVAEIDLAEVLQPVVAIRNKMIIVSLIGAVIAGILGWLTARSVTTPLGRLGQNMETVSSGNYDSRISNVHRGDEIGSLARILVAFRDQLVFAKDAEQERETLQKEQASVVENLSKALTRLADGDLTSKINTPFHGDYDKLRLDYNRSIDKLNDTIGAVVSSAQGIRKRTDEMSKASDDLSRRTENQAATLEETAAALDELTASIKSAATGAREVEKIVADAQTDADESGPVVRNAVEAMTEIEKSSDAISQIIGVIDDIAFQTNLLALNAGVEAARAGEAGRGFAVVASEVRALAQRSSDAAKQIKGLISGSSQQVERGVGLVDKAGEVLTRIVERITHISSLMTEIASGAEEQSIGLGEINVGVTQLDKVTQQNAAMVEQATSSNHALNRDAEKLSDTVAQFRLSKDATKPALPSAPVPKTPTPPENVMVFNSPRAKTATRDAPSTKPDPRTDRATESLKSPKPARNLSPEKATPPKQEKPAASRRPSSAAATGTTGAAPAPNDDLWEDF